MADDMFTKPIVYAVPGMDAVEVRRDLVYHTLPDGTELRMDVYLPPGVSDGERRPGVVFVHGGPLPAEAWATTKDWGIFRSYGRLVAASGLVGVTFSHRFTGFNALEESAASVAAACTFVRAPRDDAGDFHLDPDRLAVWAFSGGGPFLGPLLIERPAWMRCLISYYAALDLRPVKERIPGGLSEELLERFSPVACLREETFGGPPLLIARAGLDQPWLNATADAFVARALAANAMLDVMSHPRGQHGFDILDGDARSREIIARTIDFLRAHL